ncbi:MAG: C13 family peptidase [Acidobacteriota bacterium]
MFLRGLLRILALAACLVAVAGPARAADIETFDQARDRLLAQAPRSAGQAALRGDPAPRSGEISLVLDGRSVRLGQGPGWLFGLVLPDGGKRVAFVAEDGTTRFAPVSELPAGLVPVAAPAQATDAAPVDSLEAATAALTHRLLGHSLQGRRVYAAVTPAADRVTVALWRTTVTLSGGPGWLFFIDDAPTANWEHGCRFALVGADGEIRVVSARTPPKDMAGFTELTTWPHAAAVIRNAPAAAADTATATDASHRYAVIISGGYDQANNHIRYWNDCAYFFTTLKNNGFLQDHIYVLFADGTDPAIDNSLGENSNVDLNGDTVADIGYSATKANITAVFNELAGKLGSQDILYLFTTDHGGAGDDNPSPYANSNVVLYLWNESITNTEFAAEVNKVTTKATVAIFEQCYSGGMIEPLKGPNRVLMSAARFWELSYSMNSGEYDEFSFYVTQALADASKGDSNGDGIVTLEEAYAYALAKDSVQAETLDANGDNTGEHPSYYSNPWNLGRQIALGGQYPSAPAPIHGGYAQYEVGDAFPTGATPQGWKAVNRSWPLTLPFAFPLGGQTYTTAYVSSHGLVSFGNPTDTGGYNSVNGLAESVAVAPLWDRLTTAGDGNDIAVAASASGVTIVWKAATMADARPVNVAARLYPSGAVRLYYGAGNRHTSRIEQRDKTIGISAGDAATMLLGLRNGRPDLGEASALLIQPAALPPPSVGLPWRTLLLR